MNKQPLDMGAEEIIEQQFEEERREAKTAQTTPSEQKGQTIYDGEVRLILDAPVNMKMALELFDALQTIRELKLLYTIGSPSRSIVFNIEIEKPIPFIDMILSKVPGAVVMPRIQERYDYESGIISSVLNREKSTVPRIIITSKTGLTSIMKDS